MGRSGVFCAVSNAIEQFKTETIVDVFQATKAVRMHKPRAVNTLVSEIHVPVFLILLWLKPIMEWTYFLHSAGMNLY